MLPDYQKKSVQPLPFLLSFCLIGMLLFAFTLKGPMEKNVEEFTDELLIKDSLLVEPYLQINDGYGNIGNMDNMPATGEYQQNEIDYAPTFEEVMQQVPDAVLDTSSLTIGEIYDQYISLDQSLNSLQKSLDESKGLANEKVRINYSAPNVLYLLDGLAADPKKVSRYEVSSMEVFPSIAIDGVDTSRYKLVVKAESRDSGAQKLNEKPGPDKQNINKQSSPKTLDPNGAHFSDTTTYMLDNSFNIKKASPGTIISDERSISGDSVLYFLDGKRVGDGTAYDSLNIKIDEIVSVNVSKNKAALSLLSKPEQEKYKGIVYVRTSRAGKSITGTITDAKTGKPLPGTNILIKGTTTGTVSNREGAFQLQIPEGGEELVFVHIGYEEEIVSIEGKEIIDVSLKPLSAEEKQKKLEELEKKRAERISRQLPALSSLDSTLVIVNGQARKEVKSLSELNIQPDEILAINVMGTEADLAQYLDASDQGRYKKVVKIITKRYGANNLPTPPKDGKPLFIVDGEVREDIRSFEELESTVLLKSPHSISVSPIESAIVPSLTEEQLKQYEKVITIKTSRTFDPGDIESRIQGKVVDAESGEPIEGVKISDIHTDEVIALTDQKGEYRLVLENPKEKIFLLYEAPDYRRYVVPACADCFVSSTFPSLLVLPLEKENVPWKDANSRISVFPNPGDDEVKVRFNLQEAGPLEFQLLDQEGGFLKSFEQDFSSTGEQEISIPVDELPADTYFLRVKLNGQYETRRVIVQ